MYTKEELESKSDFDINKLIFGIARKGNIMEVNTEDGWIFNSMMIEVDYCNNWSDMGPLIEKIWDDLFENTGYEGQKLWDDLVSDGNKPTRAAAIVYLLGGE